MRQKAQEASLRADSRSEMPHRRWVYLTRVAAAAGLAAFAAVHALRAAGRRALHVLQHLGLRRADGARLRHRRLACVPRHTGARGVDGHHRRHGLLDVRRGLVRDLQARDVPVDGRRSGTSPSTPCSTSASSSCSARARARSAARSGSTARPPHLPPARSARPCSSRSSSKAPQGSTSVVVTNLAYPLGDVLLLSAVFGVFSLTGWRPGPRWLLLGLGVLSTALADADLPLPVGGRHVRRGHLAGHPLAARRCCSSPRRPGCPTGRARASRSKADRCSPSRQSARSSRPGSSSTTTSPGSTCSRSSSPRRPSRSSSSGSASPSARTAASSS